MTYLLIVVTFLIWLMSILTAGFIGYRLEQIKQAVLDLRTEMKKKVIKKDAEPQKSSIIDPNDLMQRAQFEQDEAVRKLNQ